MLTLALAGACLLLACCLLAGAYICNAQLSLHSMQQLIMLHEFRHRRTRQRLRTAKSLRYQKNMIIQRKKKERKRMKKKMKKKKKGIMQVTRIVMQQSCC